MEATSPFRALVTSFFPPLCIHCDARTDPVKVVCTRCELELASCLIPACEMPGLTTASREVWGTWYYRLGSPIRSMHRALKYEANQRVGALIAAGMRVPDRNELAIPDDAICIPLPSHRIRVLERGLQQTTVLAKRVASRLSISFLPNILVRQVHSPSQSGLDRSQRLSIQSNLFGLSAPIRSRHIVLVDDVMTTGATLDKAAETLEATGAKVTLIVAAFRREAFARST